MGTRFNLILEDRQYRTLTAESERQSVSVAELIRRSIDAAFSLDDRRRVPGVELSVSCGGDPTARWPGGGRGSGYPAEAARANASYVSSLKSTKRTSGNPCSRATASAIGAAASGG